MYQVHATADIVGTLEEVWAVQSDVARWPEWNSHERAARLDGPFAVGSRGWSKPRGGPAATWILTDVDAPRSWSSRSSLPGGALTGTRTFTATGADRIVCSDTMRATGPLEILFRLWFGRRIRRDMSTTFTELEAEVLRRRTGTGR